MEVKRKKNAFQNIVTEKLSNVDVSTFTDSVSIDLYDTEPLGSGFNLFFADCFLLSTDVLFESAFLYKEQRYNELFDKLDKVRG